MNACGPFVTMGILIKLLPQYAAGHVYRLNTAAGGKKRLPPYDLMLGDGVWSLDTILEWSETHSVPLDSADVWEQIEKEQTVGGER